MTSHHASRHVSDNDQSSEEHRIFPYLLTLDSDAEQLKDESVEELIPAKESEEIQSEPIETQTPITINIRTEVNHSVNEALDTMRNQLIEAQKNIADLRHIAYQSEVRAQDYELRMLTAENTLRQLVLLHPILQNAILSVENLNPLMAQSSVPTKRTLGENSNNNPPQPRVKKTKTVKASIVSPNKERGYAGNKPYCPKCHHHHKGSCGTPCKRCQLFGHQANNCKLPATGASSNVPKACFECGDTRHFRNECPQLRMKNNDPNSTTGTSYTMTQNLYDYQ